MAKKQSNAQKAAQAARREENAKKKQKKVTLALWALLAVFVLAIGAFFFYRWSRSAAAARKLTVMEVDGESLTAADYNFYYYRAYYEYMNSAADEVEGIGGKPDERYTLSSQPLFEGSSETWQDYFDSRAESFLRQTVYYYHQAQKEGFELSAEQQASVEYDFQEKIWFEAEELRSMAIDDYLAENYGKGMTEEIYRKNLTILFTANAYRDHCAETIEIDNEELADYYAAHAEEYRIVRYRLFYFSGKADDEQTQTQKMAQAESRARALAEAATDEESFIRLAKDAMQYNDEESYWKTESVEYTEQARFARSYFRSWLADSERRKGDTQVARASNGWYVAMFLERSDNDYPVVNLRWFTVSGDEHYARASEMIRSWREGEQTAERFFELADGLRDIDYSTRYQQIDSITHTNLNLASVPAILRQWAFAPGRKEGDTYLAREGDERTWVVLYDSIGESANLRLAYADLSGERFARQNAEALAGVKISHSLFWYLTEK